MKLGGPLDLISEDEIVERRGLRPCVDEHGRFGLGSGPLGVHERGMIRTSAAAPSVRGVKTGSGAPPAPVGSSGSMGTMGSGPPGRISEGSSSFFNQGRSVNKGIPNSPAKLSSCNLLHKVVVGVFKAGGWITSRPHLQNVQVPEGIDLQAVGDAHVHHGSGDLPTRHRRHDPFALVIATGQVSGRAVAPGRFPMFG